MATSGNPCSPYLQRCCLCLTRQKNALTIPCGHKYCRACTDGLISKYERTGSYSCAHCLQTFYTNPDQDGPVDILAMDKLKKTNLRNDTSGDFSRMTSSGLTGLDQEFGRQPKKTALNNIQNTADTTAGAEDVFCDVCSDTRHKAVKSCLVCLGSYCDTHLCLHSDLHVMATDTLVDAADQVKAMVCVVHGKDLNVQCFEEKQGTGCMCKKEDQKGCNMLAAGPAEKKEEFRNSEQVIAEQEKQLKELRLAKHTLRDIATATEEEIERLCSKLIRSIQNRTSVMKVLIRAQKRAELDRIKTLTEQVEQEMRHVETEQLVSTQNDIPFLQPLQTFTLTSENVLKMTVNPQFSFGEAVKSMSALKEQIEGIWQRGTDEITETVKKDKIVLPIEPKTRKDFLQYLVPLSLDPDTAHPSLSICDEKRVECSTESQPCPDHPERFDWWAQVLCREPLNTRCYWEAEWTGLHGVDIAVSYRDITRKGDDDESSFGYNKHSWSLDCAIMKYAFVHNKTEREISAPVSHRIGVYLDYKAGALSFYSVSDCMILLHRAEARFIQPLYAGFGLYPGSTVNVCQPDIDAKQITEVATAVHL